MYFHPACTFLQLHDIQFSLYIIRRYYIIITPICGMPNLWKACTLIMMAWSCATRRVLRIVLSNTYCVVFLHCLSSSCAPYVACFSGLFMFYCSFGIVFFYLFFFILEPLVYVYYAHKPCILYLSYLRRHALSVKWRYMNSSCYDSHNH